MPKNLCAYVRLSKKAYVRLSKKDMCVCLKNYVRLSKLLLSLGLSQFGYQFFEDIIIAHKLQTIFRICHLLIYFCAIIKVKSALRRYFQSISQEHYYSALLTP